MILSDYYDILFIGYYFFFPSSQLVQVLSFFNGMYFYIVFQWIIKIILRRMTLIRLIYEIMSLNLNIVANS